MKIKFIGFIVFIFVTVNGIMCIKFVSNKKKINQYEKESLAQHDSVNPEFPQQIEILLSQITQMSNGIDLKTVKPYREQRLLELEWTSLPHASLLFIQKLNQENIVGSIQNLYAKQLDHSSKIHIKASFSSPQISLEKINMNRVHRQLVNDSFKPFWNKKKAKKIIVKKDNKPSPEHLKLEKEKQAVLARQKQETKKADLRTRIKVNGIVHDGKKSMAFVSLGSNRQSIMVHEGDMLEESRVVEINQDQGIIRLSYKDQFEVILEL